MYVHVLFWQNCSPAILSECIVLGVKCTVQSYRKQQSVPQSPVTAAYMPATASLSSSEPGTLDPLLKAAELTLYRRINSIINMLPVPHQVCVWYLDCFIAGNISADLYLHCCVAVGLASQTTCGLWNVKNLPVRSSGILSSHGNDREFVGCT